MLFKCHNCLKTLKVEPKVSGTHYRCECGTMMKAEDFKNFKQAEPYHCLSCGAALEKGADNCNYCQRGVPEEKRLFIDFCPECKARIPEGAAFCMSCGARQSQGIYENTKSDLSCPHHHGLMQYIFFGKSGFHQCSECFGLWIHPKNYTQALKSSQEKGSVIAKPNKPALNVLQYIKCPECEGIMNRRNIKGFIVDACAQHGYWFDEHEFENVRHLFVTGKVNLNDLAMFKNTPPPPRSTQTNTMATTQMREEGDKASQIIKDILSIFFD